MLASISVLTALAVMAIIGVPIPASLINFAAAIPSKTGI